jgi:hypothetical protein
MKRARLSGTATATATATESEARHTLALIE